MKVIIPISYYTPEQCAGIYIVNDFCIKGAEQGLESLILAPTPTRNVPKDAVWYKDESLSRGVYIHRFTMMQEGRNPIMRALRYVFCEIVYTYFLLCKDYDVIFLDSTPPIQGLKIPFVNLFRHKPVLYNGQDIFPESLIGAGLAKKGGLLWKIGCWISNITYKNSDKIIAISKELKTTLVNKGVPEEKIEVVYNWVDSNIIIPINKNENPFYKQFSLDRNKFRVVYAGNFGNAQNINIIIAAAEKLKDNSEIEFVIFGSGGLENDIKEWIADRHLDNVKMLPLQAAEKVSCVYSLGDICIVSCKEGFGGSAMPSKTWSILSTARPVLASFDEGELMYLLQNNDCGIYTKAGDVDGLVNAIIDVSKNPVRCDEMGQKGRKYVVDNLSKDVNIQKYIDIIKELGKNNKLTI